MHVQAITTTFPALLLQARLMTLSTVDLAIIVLYFMAVLGIGFYLKRFTKTGEDFFLAGREMTAWIAGLSFLAATLCLPGLVLKVRLMTLSTVDLAIIFLYFMAVLGIGFYLKRIPNTAMKYKTM